MALQEETNQEIPTTPVENGTPITQEPTYQGLTLSELQKYAPSIKTLPSETIQNSAKEEESEFWYGFDKSESLTNNAMLYLEAHNPVFANMFSDETPDEVYGKGFTNLSVDDRRKVLLDYRKDQLKREYPILSQVPDDDLSWEASIGGLIGVLADPTTLTPVGTGLRTLGLVSAGLSGAYNMADQLANTGEVEGGELAAMTALGGVGGVVVGKGIQVVGNKIKLAQSKKSTAEEMKLADLEIDKINYVLAKASVDDLTIGQAQKLIEKDLGITQEGLIKILSKTDRKPVFPSKLNAQVTLNTVRQGFNESSRISNGVVERLFGNLSTKIGKISEPVKLKIRDFERKVHQTRGYSTLEFQPLIKSLKKVPKNIQPTLNTHLMNGEFSAAKQILQSNVGKDSIASFDRAIKELDRLLKMKEKTGLKLDKIDNYFPRTVKDFDGLQAAMGKNRTLSGVYDKALKDYAASKSTTENPVSVLNLTQKQKEDVIAKVSQGYRTSGVKNKKLSWTKDRVIPKITEEMSQYYDDAGTSLFKHLNSSADDIHKRELFGKSVVNTLDGADINLDESIAGLIAKDLANLDPSRQELLKTLLQTRFGMAEQLPHVALRKLRDAGYMTTLANPLSAMTQIKDLGISAYIHGIFPTVKAIFGKKNISMKELGLDNVMASEFTNVKDASTALHTLLSASGFRRVDRFGKDVFLNTAFKQGGKLAKTAKGQAKLAKKYKEAFGEGEFNMLLNELKAGTPSERVKLYLWSELSDVQPISLSEMPQTYLNNPNGRILYSLKSFAIKQLDLIRRTIVDEYTSGSKLQAGKNLARYSALVAIMGGTVDETKDLILGRGFDIDDVATDGAVTNLLNVVGLNKYAIEKLQREGAVPVVIDQLTPPIPFISNLVKDYNAIGSDSGVASNALKEVPIIGRLTYQWLGGGIEKDLKREAQQRKKERVFN